MLGNPAPAHIDQEVNMTRNHVTAMRPRLDKVKVKGTR